MAKPKTKTTAEQAKPKSRAVLKTVETRSKKLQDLLDRSKTARDDLDKTLLAAREAGFTYREIAESCGRSTAWVQSSLERGGYKTKPRSRKD